MDRSDKPKTGRVYAAFVQHKDGTLESIGEYSCSDQGGDVAFYADQEILTHTPSREYWHRLVDSMPDAELDLLYVLLRKHFGGSK